MLGTLNSESWEGLAAEAGRSRWMAQARLLLGAFGLSTALLYLSTEVFGKMLARARSGSKG